MSEITSYVTFVFFRSCNFYPSSERVSSRTENSVAATRKNVLISILIQDGGELGKIKSYSL